MEAIADVRQFPGSRRHPHFHEQALSGSLTGAGIEYHSFRDLGGRRTPRPDSPNTAWRNAGFRGYADYMETAAFRAGIERLMELAARKRTAVMCAEVLWWRCHRSMISDYLKAAGVLVTHILGPAKTELHPYTAAARIVDGRLTYTPAPGEMLFE